MLVRFAPAVADEARGVLAEGGISALQAHPAAWPFVVELAAAASAHLLGPSARTVCWSRLVRAALDPLDLIARAFGGLREAACVLTACAAIRRRRDPGLRLDPRGGSKGGGAGAVLSVDHLGKVLRALERRTGTGSDLRARALLWERGVAAGPAAGGGGCVALAVQRAHRFQAAVKAGHGWYAGPVLPTARPAAPVHRRGAEGGPRTPPDTRRTIPPSDGHPVNRYARNDDLLT